MLAAQQNYYDVFVYRWDPQCVIHLTTMFRLEKNPAYLPLFWISAQIAIFVKLSFS